MNTKKPSAKSQKKSGPVAKKVKKPAQKKPKKTDVGMKKLKPTDMTMRGPRPMSVYGDRDPESIEGFRKAELSARAALIKYSRDPFDVPPLPFDAPVSADRFFGRLPHLRAYFSDSGSWLGGCEENIRLAIEAGDEDFFLRLADFIRDRPKYRAASLVAEELELQQPTDPLPKRITDSIRALLAFRWVTWGLWLMPDPVAFEYIQKFDGPHFKRVRYMGMTPPNYTKLRDQLDLFQHRQRPVVAFNEDGTLVFRPGWKNPAS